MINWKADNEKINGRYISCLSQVKGGGITWMGHDDLELSRETACAWVQNEPSNRLALVWDRRSDKMAAFAGPKFLLKGFDRKAFRRDLKQACGSL